MSLFEVRAGVVGLLLAGPQRCCVQAKATSSAGARWRRQNHRNPDVHGRRGFRLLCGNSARLLVFRRPHAQTKTCAARPSPKFFLDEGALRICVNALLEVVDYALK